MIHIELETIDPASNWFVISRSQLDSDKVLAPDDFEVHVEGTFVLDQSYLDSEVDLLEGLSVTQPGYIWQDITCESTSVEIARGMNASRGITARAEAGTLKAKVIDPYLDALANEYVGIGTKVRVREGKEVIFVGSVKNLQTSYDATGIPFMTIDAVDGIARMNSVLLPGRSAEAYGDRIDAIADSVGLFAISDEGAEVTGIGDTNALDMLYTTQDSEGSYVWIDRYNRIVAPAWDRYTIPMVPQRINLYENPSFEENLDTWWSGQTFDRVRGGAGTGVYSFGATCSSADSNLAYAPITVSEPGEYIVSAYFKAGAALDGVGVWIQGEGGSATYTNGTNGTVSLVANQWVRAYRRFTVTSPGTILVVHRLAVAPTGFSGQVIKIDSCLAEAGTELLPYFDGSMPKCEWAGAENNSQSYELGPVATWLFSNDHSEPGHICLTRFQTSMDTDEVVNTVTFNNIELVEGDYRPVAYTFADSESANYYGIKKQTVTTTCDPEGFAYGAAWLFDTFAEAEKKIKRLAFKVTNEEQATIDIGDVIKVHLIDPPQTALDEITEHRRVIAINHTITPLKWECELLLI